MVATRQTVALNSTDMVCLGMNANAAAPDSRADLKQGKTVQLRMRMIHSRRFIVLMQIPEVTDAARPLAQEAAARAAIQGPVAVSSNRAQVVSRA